MSMRVVFLKDHEQYKAQSVHIVPRSLGAILSIKGIAVSFTEQQELLRKESERKARAEVEKKAKAASLLKEREEREKETATSKKAKTRSRAVKK